MAPAGEALTISVGPTGVQVPIREDGSHLAVARELEGLGVDTVWIAGGQLDRLTRVTDLIAATDSVRVATGIVPLGRYDTAAIAALADAAGERLVLGLGGPQEAHPLDALGRHLDELDAVGVGPTRRLLAALGPRKLDIAAERAAGAITLLTTPGYTAYARARLGAGPLLAVHEYVVLSTDAARARPLVREHARLLVGVGGYRANLLRIGFTDDDVDSLSDRLVDGVSARGTAADVVARVRRHHDAGADHVNLCLLGVDGPGELTAAVAELAGQLA